MCLYAFVDDLGLCSCCCLLSIIVLSSLNVCGCPIPSSSCYRADLCLQLLMHGPEWAWFSDLGSMCSSLILICRWDNGNMWQVLEEKRKLCEIHSEEGILYCTNLIMRIHRLRPSAVIRRDAHYGQTSKSHSPGFEIKSKRLALHCIYMS